MGFFSSLFSAKEEALYVQGPDEYSQDVVGESHHQRALKKIAGGYASKEKGHFYKVQALVVHEDDNPHDKQAVRIDISGHTVGHLSRDDARIFRRKMMRHGLEGRDIICDAAIVGGWNRGLFDKGHFGVRLDLPVDDL